ncbi:MAG: DUF4347 domain-containing protein, partial [Magnetococcales bacterium]|nr:DUF4347 domain-containing protein [Magnetococcales bacterium]
MAIASTSLNPTDALLATLTVTQTDGTINVPGVNKVPAVGKKRILFVDPRVPDYGTLLNSLDSDVRVVILNEDQDGIAQISTALADQKDVSSIHILSHGSPGSLELGATTLSSANLSRCSSEIRNWSNALTPDADLLLYGCDVAVGDTGADFVQELSRLTGADVAASTNKTGDTVLGGDWNLEDHFGTIEAESIVTNGVAANYHFLLTSGPIAEPLNGDYGNTTDTATSLSANQTATGTISPSGDRDWFAVSLTAGVLYTFNMQGSASGHETLSSPWMMLRDSSDNAVASCYMSGDGVGLVFLPSVDGTYYLDAQGSSGTYSLKFAPLTAATLSGNSSTGGEISTSDENDWYAISLTAGTLYSFDMKGTASSHGTLANPFLVLMDGNGQWVNMSSQEGDARVVFAPTDDGTYYLSAQGIGANTGTYTISNTTLNVASIAAGGTAHGGIALSGGEDWFSTSLAAGVLYAFNLQGSASGHGTLADPSIALFDGWGDEIGSNDNFAGNSDATIFYKPTYNGNLYLDVQGVNSSTGTYLLISNVITPASLSVGDQVGGDISTSGESDLFAVHLTSGTVYSFDLQGASGNQETLANPYLLLLDSSLNVLKENDNAAGFDSNIVYVPASMGTYYLDAKGVGSSTGTYTLHASSPEDIGSTVGSHGTLSVGNPVHGVIASYSDHDWYEADVTAGVVYLFRMQGAASNNGSQQSPNLTLRDSNGDAKINEYGSIGDKTIIYAPSVSGSVYLDAGGDVGTYALTMDTPTDVGNAAATSGSLGIGQSVSGIIAPSGDHDWFKVNLAAGASYSFEMKSGQSQQFVGVSNSSPRLYLKDSSGNTVISNYEDKIVYTPDVSGEYYLDVGTVPSSSYIGSYTLTATTDTVDSLRVGHPVTGTIASDSQADLISVSLDAGTDYVFSLHGMSNSYGTLPNPVLQYSLFGAAGDLIGTNDNSFGTDSTFGFRPVASGTYYISVQSTTNSYQELGSGGYTLNLSASSDVGNSISSHGSLALGSSLNSTIDSWVDSDWFAVSLTGGALYSFDLQGYDNGLGTLSPYGFSLRDSSGNLVKQIISDGAGQDIQLSYQPLATGNYFLDVGGLPDPSNNHDYLHGISTYTLSGRVVSASSLSANTTITREISAPCEDDWYAVSLSANTLYSFSMQAVNDSGSQLSIPYLLLRDSSGNLLSDYSRDYYHGSKIDYKPTISGTFYLEASSEFQGYGGPVVTGGYTINYTPVSPTPFTIGDSPSSGEISTNGENDWYSVSLQAGKIYTFTMQGASSSNGTLTDASLSLTDGSGHQTTGTRSNNSSDASLTFMPAHDGTYYLDVGSSSNNQTGTYLLTGSETSTVLLNENSLMAGEITDPGEQDLYSVNLTSGNFYQFDMQGTSLSNPWFALKDSNNNYINRSAVFDLNRGIFQPTVDGTYYLSVGGVSSTNTGSYAIEYSSIPVVQLSVNTSVSGMIFSPNETDIFAISLSAGTTYMFDLQNNTTDAYIEFKNDNGSFVTFNKFYTPKADGTYYLDVSGASTGNYTLTNKVVPTTQLLTNHSVSGVLSPTHDSDLYSVSLQAGTFYSFDMQSISNNQDIPFKPQLALWSREGGYGYSSDINDNHNTRMFFLAPDSATYYLEAANAYYSDMTGSGSYTVNYAPVAVTQLNIGAQVSGEISSSNKVSLFEIYLTDDTIYSFNAHGTSSGSGNHSTPYISLLDGGGSKIKSNSDYSGSTDSTVYFKTGYSGYYYVEVEGVDDSYTGNFTLDSKVETGGGTDLFVGSYRSSVNDSFTVSNLTFRMVDGDQGTDTLALSGSGMNLNLTEQRGKIKSIENIDLTGSGNNTLTLSALDMLYLSGNNNTLTVTGDAGDVVNAGGGWTAGSVSGGFRTYSQGDATLRVASVLSLVIDTVAGQMDQLSSTALFGLSDTQLNGLTSIQLARLTDTQLDGLTSSQLSGLANTQLDGLSSLQLASLADTQFAGLSSQQVAALADTQLAALSSSQLSLLQSIASSGTVQFNDLTSVQLFALTNTQLNALTSTQLSEFSDTLLDGLTSVQLSSLADTQLDGLKSLQLSSLADTQLAGIAATQLAGLENTQLDGLTSMQLMALSTSQLSDHGGGQTILVSVDSSGNPGNTFSNYPSVSADGRYVAFLSDSSNLVAGDANENSDIFLRDTKTGQTSIVSVDSTGNQGNGRSHSPAISADGRYVAFASNSSNLVAGDTNGASDIFLRDVQNGQTSIISVDSSGSQSNGYSADLSISADGRFVVFTSSASNLVAGDTNGFYDIFLRDVQNGQTSIISVDSSGNHGNDNSLYFSSIAGGRYVAFASDASNLVAGDTNGWADIFLHDTQTGQTSLISVDSLGNQSNSGSYGRTISSDGRYVVFSSYASNLVTGDTNGVSDIFLRDTQTDETSIISVGLTGNHGSNFSCISISADGKYIVFTSDASNLVAGDANGTYDIFLSDIKTGTLSIVSLDSSGNQGNAGSIASAINADGRYVVFESDASNLTAGDINGSRDVFLRRIFMPGEAGLSSTQLAGLSATQLDGLASLQLVAFSSDQLNGLTSTQFTSLADTQLDGLTADQFMLLADTQLNGLNSVQLIALADTQLNGLSLVQLTGLANTQLDGLTSINLASLADTQLGGLTSVTLAGLADTQLNGVTSLQLSSLSATQWIGLTSPQLTGLAGTQLGIMTSASLSLWSTAQLDGLTSVQLAAFSDTTLNGLRSVQLASLANTQLSGISATQLAGLANTQLDGLTSAQLNALSVSQLTGLGNGRSAQTILVSVDSSGYQSNGESFSPSVSDNGRYIAFCSNASNLVSSDLNGCGDIFLRDTQTGQTSIVSVDSFGNQGNGGSYSPSISADGRYVAFFSYASNLVAGDTNGVGDVFLRDTQTGQTLIISVDSSGNLSNGHSSSPSISADGRYVAFDSNASNLVVGDANSTYDVFLRDTQAGQTVIVSVDSSGNQGNTGSGSPSISADGRYVTFASGASNLVEEDGNVGRDIFLRDVYAGQTAMVSVGISGSPGDHGDAFLPSISADGRYVIFSSPSSDLVVGDINGNSDIFLRDIQNNETSIVSIGSEWNSGSSDSYLASVSADGRYMSFWSSASQNIYMQDRQTGQISIIHADPWDKQTVSADGKSLTFDSSTSDLVNGDLNGFRDIFLYKIIDGRNGGLSSTQMAGLSVTQLDGLTSLHLTAFSDDQLNGLTSTKFTSLADTQLDGLTADQLMSLANTQLDGLSSLQLASLADTQLAGFSSQQVAALADTQLAALSSSQLALLQSIMSSGTVQFDDLTSIQLFALSDLQLNVLTSTQLSAFSDTVLNGLSSVQLSSLSNTQLDGLKSLQLSSLVDTQLAGIAATQLAGLANTQLDGLTSMQLRALSTSQLADHGGGQTILVSVDSSGNP